jgi:hypothetical protein
MRIQIVCHKKIEATGVRHQASGKLYIESPNA